MSRRYHPKDIPALRGPITAANTCNARNHPAVDLGLCTPSQLLSQIGVPCGAICVLGSAHGISIADILRRRAGKPFLFLGTERDRTTICAALAPEWIAGDSMGMGTERLPSGSGALLFQKPYSAYLAIAAYLEDWSEDRFLILHVGSGLQLGAEALNLVAALDQCLLLCDGVPQSIRAGEAHAVTPLDFLRLMRCLLVFSTCGVAHDLIEVLPTYSYEKVTNTSTVNTYRSASFLHPFPHRTHGISLGQSRTMEYKKNAFEMDELQRLLESGCLIAYTAVNNRVYLARLTA